MRFVVVRRAIRWLNIVTSGGESCKYILGEEFTHPGEESGVVDGIYRLSDSEYGIVTTDRRTFMLTCNQGDTVDVEYV